MDKAVAMLEILTKLVKRILPQASVVMAEKERYIEEDWARLMEVIDELDDVEEFVEGIEKVANTDKGTHDAEGEDEANGRLCLQLPFHQIEHIPLASNHSLGRVWFWEGIHINDIWL